MNRILHTYRQAPWRIQRQIIGLFLAGLVVLTMLAALYLDVISQSAMLGREIQRLESEIAATRQDNADLETRIADAMATDVMEARARAMGYIPVQASDLEYLPVSGYVPKTGVKLAEAPNPKLNVPTVPLEYTQSLLEWFEQHMQGPGLNGGAR